MSAGSFGLLLAASAAGLLLSAFLTLVETAVFSVGPTRLRTLEEEGFAGHARLSALRA
jgi:Mg2+/Co2+ transporter CorB